MSDRTSSSSGSRTVVGSVAGAGEGVATCGEIGDASACSPDGERDSALGDSCRAGGDDD